jgi:hypothetical protein
MTTPDVPGTETAPNQLGKRYECPECGASLICTKAGTGRVTCHGSPMALVTAKPLPSSD